MVTVTDSDDEHGRDFELTHEEPAADDEEDAELEAEREAAQREAAEEDRRQDIEHGTSDRETDARETANPHMHRDEPPENS